MYRDGARKSIWQEEVRKFSTETDLNSLFDVAIIGVELQAFQQR